MGYGEMPESPLGRDIRYVDGNAAAIVARGTTIESLGERMQMAANTLRLIAEGQVGRGLSLDEIKDQADDVHADLKTAGLRYMPSGAALRAYGEALDEVQPDIASSVDTCVELWNTVRSRAGSVERAEDTPDDPDGSSTARDEAEAAATGALTRARQEWEDAAAKFDGHYDTWETAYEKAVSSLEQVNEDGVEDGFWDDALPFLDALVEVLEIVGIVLLVLALVVGGPLFAILATIAALVTLLATVVLFAKGRKNGWDLALAIVGVIPFGKLGRIAAAAKNGSGVAKFTGPAKFFVGADEIAQLQRHFGIIGRQARVTWNNSGRLVPWASASLPSSLIYEARIAMTYVGRHAEITNSADIFLGRLWGVGDSLSTHLDGGGAAAMVDVAFGTKLPWAQAVQTTDVILGEIAEAADELKVDAWR